MSSDGIKVHGKYETAKKKKVMNYMRNSINFITNIVNNEKFYIKLYKIARKTWLEAVITYLEEKKPK